MIHFFDISVAVVLLGAISFIGVYKARQSSTNGNQKPLGVISVALSVCSGYLSAVSLLGFPSEVYFRGAMLYWYGIMYCIAFPIIAYVFLPILYDEKYSNVYHYLEFRFSFYSRFIASISFIIMTVIYMSIALYAPALALSSILDIPLLVTIITTAVFASFYLYSGGLKAGILTSALQMILILLSFLAIVMASLYQYGLTDIYNSVVEDRRLYLVDFRMDPRIRHSAPALIIGGTFLMISLFATNQLSVQRYTAMRSLQKAQHVVLLNIPINFAILTMYVIVGLIMYGVYDQDCQPDIKKQDQIFPTFVLHKLSWIPGMVGLFVAAIYSAGISTLTASYNALSEVLIEDIISVWYRKYHSSKALNLDLRSKLSHTLPIGLALISILFAYCINHMDTMILEISFSIFGASGGIIVGVYFIGMFCPWIKSPISALFAQLCSIYFILFLVIMNIYYKNKPFNLPLSNMCSLNGSSFLNHPLYEYHDVMPSPVSTGVLHWLSQISYQYYTLVGVLVTFVVANALETFIRLENLITRYQQKTTAIRRDETFEMISTMLP
uniref:Sodium/solute symporter n=1 Tax=Rhabditophanes sp. KR3021 TaxID=114890 RepID=A0AC35U612_9BILA